MPGTEHRSAFPTLSGWIMQTNDLSKEACSKLALAEIDRDRGKHLLQSKKRASQMGRFENKTKPSKALPRVKKCEGKRTRILPIGKISHDAMQWESVKERF